MPVEAEGFGEAGIGESPVLLLGVEVAQVTDGVGHFTGSSAERNSATACS